MANLSVCASIIPDCVETTSGVSSSVYPLTTMVTNYLALVLVEGSLTPWTEVLGARTPRKNLQGKVTLP